MTTVAPTHHEGTVLTPPQVRHLTNRNPSPSRALASPGSTPPAELSELLRDKERRAEQQRGRCVEERERRLEEQRRKEARRRAAAEERRRLQQEEEKERLEALVRRRAGGAADKRGRGAGEAGRDPPENRPKRWTWGGPPDGAEGTPKTLPCPAIGSAQPNELPAASRANQSRNVNDFLTPTTPDQPINKRLSNSSAAIHSPERASSGTQRPHRSSSNRRSVTGSLEENTGDKTPTDGQTPPNRSSSFRTQGKGPSTPKRVRSTKNRALSPCSPGQYPPSPVRHRAPTPGSEDRGHIEGKGPGTLERKSSKVDAPERKIPKSTSKELAGESPCTPTGRSVGGTSDAEEAGRMLAERRRLARVQKEQEERQRQEDESLRQEEEERRQKELLEQQELAALQEEENRICREDERKRREEEERRQKEQRWKDMQDQLDREREEACLRAQKEAERKRQERELLHIQEEQERLQRKKRIEEIMKRTRKTEGELQSPAPVSDARGPPGLIGEDEAPRPAEAPHIMLGPLETKSCLDELSDGVQSMDVSPVSRDDQASAQDFSPVTEGGGDVPYGLEHMSELSLHGPPGDTPAYPKLRAGSGAALGDLNKNLLIQAYSAASESSQLIHSLGPGKLDVL
ncbi:MAP7 domain-containing protein 2-like [Gadus chalcogrammus]|uniref:MAP7 domain-containing protein 2-like n=1 Tax=Gadus chalcogrammus TaxID=1042646 RepID=UPI0024C4AED4|nr:MAP7 domain-containing protein 2-like [Gadus chalcogrammus]